MKENGKKISNTERVLRHGLMVLAMMVTMSKARSMALENSPGPMVLHMRDSSLITILMEKVTKYIISYITINYRRLLMVRW